MTGDGKHILYLLARNARTLLLAASVSVAAALFSVSFSITFISCSRTTEDASFMTALDNIDASISTGQTDDALALLKKIEKKAYSSYARLGIYRRYMTLGETERAENILVRGLKQIPENRELSAVYGQFLLRQNRVDEAAKVSACLSGTPYGSIYSEAVLRIAQANAAVQKNSSYYLSSDLGPVYYDAYTGTRDYHWLINTALIDLKKGDYDSAESLHASHKSGPLEDMREALFWALVEYDCGNFSQCLNELDSVPADDSLPADVVTLSEQDALRADAFMMLGDPDAAESYRVSILTRSLTDPKVVVQPSLYVNSAHWAKEHNQIPREHNLLFACVTKFPAYIPGLVSYGSFAYESSKPPVETALAKDVRKTKLRTFAMQQYDALPKVPVSDALYRMSSQIDLQKKQNGVADAELLAAYKQLQYKTTPALNEKARVADVWKTLEANETGTDLYPPALVQFAVHELLAAGLTEDARGLFTGYLDARYLLKGMTEETDKKENVKTDIFGGEKKENKTVTPPEVVRAAFGDRAADGVTKMESWECETAAYFAVLDKNIAAAKRLYEYVLFETGAGRLDPEMENGDTVSYVSPLASPSAIVNLAMIYSSTEEKAKALSLYGAAAGRTQDPLFKAVVLYRTACIQQTQGDDSDALLSVEYALSLNPAYADARLLLRELQQAN